MIKVPEELNMLKDVHIPSPIEDYVLTYDAATGLWGAEAGGASFDGGLVTDANNTIIAFDLGGI